MAITECSGLEGKIVQRVRLFDVASEGPEVVVEFSGGEIFSVKLTNENDFEAKCYRDEGGGPFVIADFTSSRCGS